MAQDAWLFPAHARAFESTENDMLAGPSTAPDQTARPVSQGSWYLIWAQLSSTYLISRGNAWRTAFFQDRLRMSAFRTAPTRFVRSVPVFWSTQALAPVELIWQMFLAPNLPS